MSSKLYVEIISGRKLNILITILMLSQLIWFIVAGIIAPAQKTSMSVLATKCIDEGYPENKMYWARGPGKCRSTYQPQYSKEITPNDVIYVFQFPLPRAGVELAFSRWQQTLRSELIMNYLSEHKDQPDIRELKPEAIYARLGYRNKGDESNNWTEIASSAVHRQPDCSLPDEWKGNGGDLYDCTYRPLFELGSLYHDFYLLNVRLAAHTEDEGANATGVNDVTAAAQMEDMWLNMEFQNGGFTKVVVSLRTIFFVIILVLVSWFSYCVFHSSRPSSLVERMIIILAIMLLIFNVPMEYLTLFYDCPWMPLFEDIRRNCFQIYLFAFWIVFVGEYDRLKMCNDFRAYRLQVVLVVALNLLYLGYLIPGHLYHSSNPFNSFWMSSDVRENLASFLIAWPAVLAAFVLIYIVVQAFKECLHPSSTPLPAKDALLDSSTERNFFRLKIIMAYILICVVVTVGYVFFEQINEFQSINGEVLVWDTTSLFIVGMYGMWNIFPCTLLVLYAPLPDLG